MLPEKHPISQLQSMRWYALYVKSRQEKTVHAQLDAKHQDVFLPMYDVRNKWADRWKTVSLPLFPGYVFCRFDLSCRYAVLATSGVIDVVRVGPEPAPIEHSEIEALQRIVSSKAPAEPYPNLVKGYEVEIIAGPLKGVTGIVTTIRSSVRLAINIDILCRSVVVEIDRECVKPIESVPTFSPSVTAVSTIAWH